MRKDTAEIQLTRVYEVRGVDFWFNTWGYDINYKPTDEDKNIKNKNNNEGENENG